MLPQKSRHEKRQDIITKLMWMKSLSYAIITTEGQRIEQLTF